MNMSATFPGSDSTPALATDSGRLPERFEVRLGGRPLQIRLSPRAVTALQEGAEPLLVQMELYFSCLVRKAVYFLDPEDPAAAEGLRQRVSERFWISFRPVTTAQCAVAEVTGAPPVETMPVKHPAAFVPRWLQLDYRRGQWQGEYGY